MSSTLNTTFIKNEVADIQDAIVSATGYTGSGGCEIYVANDEADRLWTALWKAVRKLGLKNIGLAHGHACLEMGFASTATTSTTPPRRSKPTDHQIRRRQGFIDRGQCKDHACRGRTKAWSASNRRAGIPRHGYKLADNGGGIIGAGDFRDDVALSEKASGWVM